jgi:AcrR family transcriptional regulator
VERRRYQKRLKASERREAVLDAALALIARTGEFRVTMAQVAAEAGVTKPIVYDYFANAEQLMDALLKREGARARAVMSEVLAEPARLQGREGKLELLLARLGVFLHAVCDNPSLWRVMLMPPEGTAASVRDQVEREREVVRLRIVQLLEWALPRAARRDLDLELLSHSLHAVAQRFARQMVLDPAAFPPERVLAFVRRVLKPPRL